VADKAALESKPDLADAVRLEAVYSPSARQAQNVNLTLPAGSNIGDALPKLASAFGVEVDDLLPLEVGIWGIRCTPDQILAAGDRIEFYRPLRVDPKVARRERFVRQGAKTAGLFAKRRPGAKAGY